MNTRSHTTYCRLALAAALITLRLAGRSSAQGAPSHEISAIYRLSGQPAGTYHESSSSDHGASTASIETDLVFNRLGAKIEMKSSSQFDENSDGRLKSIVSEQSSSQQTTHLDVQVAPNSLSVTTTTGGKSYQRDVPYTGTLLGPNGARRLLLARLHAPGDSVSYQTFSPELGGITTVTSNYLGTEDVSVGGKTIHSVKVEQSLDIMPGKSTLWFDSEGWLVRQTVPSPLGDIEALRSDAASGSSTQGASLPEETFTRSIVKANIRLPEERLIESIKLKIIHKRPELGWPELESDNQHVIEQTANYAVIEVNRIRPQSDSSRLLADSQKWAAFLAPNALLQSDDADIQRIAHEVAGDEHAPWAAAQKLQRWTNLNMKFDPGIAIAPASEVVRNRRGTCFGYSMLLASLTRAAGIPSRLRMGYVYAGGIWGGHAWIDVRIGNAWIPLDGALYSPGAADAARFSFFTSSLESGTLNGIGGLAQLFGNIDVTILEYTVHGKRIEVPGGAKPFTVRSDTYQNPWVGFSIRKPKSFQFVDLNAVWPESILLKMKASDGEVFEMRDLSVSLPPDRAAVRAELTEKGGVGKLISTEIAGHKVLLGSGTGKAVAVFRSGGNFWEFVASGSQSQQLIEHVVGTLKLTR